MHPLDLLSKRLIVPFICILLLLTLLPGRALAAFTIEDEKKLGKELYDKLQKGNLLLQNDLVNRYITQLGNRILARSEQAPFDFRFSVIRSSAINAFATPGGYVYINQGLINLVENEAQLASVIAHEIAHVNGRHIAAMVDKQTKISISTLAAVLAGALLGGSGDTAAALTSLSVATAATLSLKYSREHEEAADRAGLSYLVASGYQGRSSLDFLKIMRRYEFYSNTVPSYFLSHPGTDERSYYIDSLLQTTFKEPGAEQFVGNLKRIQVILLLDTRKPDVNLPYFRKELTVTPDSPDLLYGLAVTQDMMGMTQEALESFRKALALVPDDPEALRDLGISHFKLGQFDEAARNLRRAVALREKDTEANVYLGKTLVALGQMAEALRLYKSLESQQLPDPEIQYNLAVVYGKTGQQGESHYYFGLYFKKKGKTDSALFHFKAALKAYPPNSAKATEIKKEIEALEKDRPPDPQLQKRESG